MTRVSPAVGQDSEAAGRLYEEALERAEDEGYEEALSLLEEARSLAPGHLGLYLTAAQILAVDLEDHAGARQMLEEAERIRPGAPMVAYTRADLLFHSGDLEGAERAFRELAQRPDLAPVAPAGLARTLLARGRQMVERGRYPQAMPLLQESLSLEQTGAAHLNLGICFHALREAQQSHREYMAAIEAEPENPLAYFHLGMLMADCGEPERAAAAFAQTLSVEPEHPEARHYLARMQAMMGNHEAAANVLMVELERNPDCAECHSLLSVAYLTAGDREAALPHLEAAVRLNPDDFVGRYNLASIYALENRYAEALPHLRRARELDPELFVEGWNRDEQFAGARERPEFRELAEAA